MEEAISTSKTKDSSPYFSDVKQLSYTRKALSDARKTRGDAEEYDTKNLANGRPWLYGPLPLSRQGCRFELPMDVKILEKMTVVNYLTSYCIVSKRRKHLFKTIFTKADRDRDGIINSFELRQAILDLYSQSVNINYLEDILNLIDCQVDSVFDWKQFAAIAAFSERYLCICYQQSGELNVGQLPLEQTDFGGLKAKLEGCDIPTKLGKTLLLL